MPILSLKNQSDFNYVNLGGRRFHRDSFTIVIKGETKEISTNMRGSFYLGMKVSKKLGNAVIRNKIKRQIRHIIRDIYCKYDCTQGTKRILLAPKKGFEKTTFAKIYEEISDIIFSLK